MKKLGQKLFGNHPVKTWTFNAQHHCVGFYKTWSGIVCVNAAVENMSLENATNRRRIRRVANELLRVCDNVEKRKT